MEGFQKPEGARLAPNWPPDNVSFDFAHIASLRNSEQPIELTSAVLQQLLVAGSHQTGRGGVLSDPAGTYGPAGRRV